VCHVQGPFGVAAQAWGGASQSPASVWSLQLLWAWEGDAGPARRAGASTHPGCFVPAGDSRHTHCLGQCLSEPVRLVDVAEDVCPGVCGVVAACGWLPQEWQELLGCHGCGCGCGCVRVAVRGLGTCLSVLLHACVLLCKSMYTCVCPYACASTCGCVYMCLCAPTCVCVYSCVSVYPYVSVYVCGCPCVSVCTQVWLHVSVCIFVCLRTHG
jgi:hypothetical protein